MCSSDSSLEPVASSPSVDSTPRVDPLADAFCLQCSYPLRGLTEYRCPECGKAFDPKEMAGSFLPEWPRLMVWYVVAALMAGVLGVLSFTLSIMTTSGSFSFSSSFGVYHDFSGLFGPATTILVAPFAMVGLSRRIDWGRKAAIGLFGLHVIPLVPTAIYVVFRLCTSRWRMATLADIDQLLSFFREWNLAFQVSLPSFLLAWLLWTGLRRRSLRRSASDPMLLLPRRLFSPKDDWLIVLVALLAAEAIKHFGTLGATVLGLISVFAQSAPVSHQFGQGIASILYAVQLGWLVWIARAIWRDPASARRSLKSFLIVAVACCVAILILAAYFTIQARSILSAKVVVFQMSWVLISLLPPLILPSILYLYVSRVLPASVVARAAGTREQRG